MRHARPLEVARWEYFFGQGSKDTVIRYLAAYQNQDGGFGHGIEPDFWLPESSPMATWAAGQILIELKADLSEPIVQKLVSYLTEFPQVEEGIWPSVLEANNKYPHASWWHWQAESQQFWMYNPSVELAAFLTFWAPELSSSAQIGWRSLRRASKYLMQSREMDHHLINNYRRFAELVKPIAEVLPDRIGYCFAEIEAKVLELIKGSIDDNVKNWGSEYQPLPLDFVDSPASLYYKALEPLVHQNLELFINQVSPEGIWGITWEWDDYLGDFAVAKKYWQAILAVKRYRILREFGLLPDLHCR